MASGWVKSLPCSSRAFDDVIEPAGKRKPIKVQARPRLLRHSVSAPHHPVRNRPDPYLPALSDLPEGHPSRNVVEMIFRARWSPNTFVGRIELVFKVQHGARTLARFKEYRETVKVRAGSGGRKDDDEENARCVADGNELMRFHCLGPTNVRTGASGTWLFSGGRGAAMCTFGRTEDADENAGGGRGRRAMLVCRVIAGRVSRRSEFGYDSLADGRVRFDSVSGENGELLVFDPRAVLPCFLIIYIM